MSSDYDATEFIDGDLQAHRAPASATPVGASQPARAPTREEVDSKVSEAQQKLAELKRVQEDLERERAALEETRRRQLECRTGREEMVQHLTRGLGLLTDAEFNARNEAEQMTKALAGLREALDKVQAICEESWTRDNFSVELTRALTVLEGARMEWNSARLKFPVLAGESPPAGKSGAAPAAAPATLLTSQSFGQLCRLGLALTWPVGLAVFLGLLLGLLLRR